MPPPLRYNTGYNVGVGGAVVQDGRLLLVRRASRRGRGNWQVPGGFIEPDETIEQAVIREVMEEANVNAEVEGILGLRNRCDPDVGNSLYIVLLLHPVSGEPEPDGKEVDRAAYFTMEEIRALEQVPSINVEIAQRALSIDKHLLMPQTLAHHVTGAPYMLFVG
jgi:ADP-ribose pyrophosphatase YjhB (NUDIX family)